MKNFQPLIVLLILLASVTVKGQYLDSARVSFDGLNQELSIRVFGRIEVLDANAIVSSSDSIYRDTLELTIHFLPCAISFAWLHFDTTFTLQNNLSPGIKQVKILSYKDGDTNSSNCTWNLWPGYRDTVYANVYIPLDQNEYHPYKLSVFPNPVKKDMEIEFPTDLRRENITITNSIGNPVAFKIIGRNRVDVSELRKGIYFLTVREDKKHYRVKLIKE